MRKNIITLLFLMLMAIPLMGADAEELVLIGNIPGRYLKISKKYSLGYIHIKNRVIIDIKAITSQAALNATRKKFAAKNIVITKGGAKTTKGFDFLYPGLIDLHNHTKQNNLDVWGLAKGQFKNRFEWRAWSGYKYSVSGNMNPWIGYGKPIECAAFRWSEMAAMSLGTTYLQGPSKCIKNFGIHQVEDKGSYISNKDKIQAPTDLVIPGDMTFVWQVLRPLILQGMSYEKALATTINKHCSLPGINERSIMQRSVLKMLKDQKKLRASCTKGTLHRKFIRYVYWIHGSIAGKKAYLKRPTRAAIIAHLAEGRRDDYYNQKEYEIVKLLGLDQPYVNFVHGVGIKKKHLREMGRKKMGLIWSPFSNLILYGQTLDIKAAKAAGIKMSIGSDWLPTGTRGILEEVKVAANYIDKDIAREGLKRSFTDLQLYLMLTENPAQMINHWKNGPSEHGIGRLAVGSMGTVIALKKFVEDPYTNIVRKAYAKDVNLVVIDGKILYGNTPYLTQAGISSKSYEVLPSYYKTFNRLKNEGIKVLQEDGSDKSSKMNQLIYLGKTAKRLKLGKADRCGIKVKKGFVHQNSLRTNPALADFKSKTGLNLDRFEDIQRLLAVSMITQSRNLNNSRKGKKEYAVTEFPSLFACNDEYYTKRVFNFINPKSSGDEFTYNRNPSNVENLRAAQRHGRVPEKLKNDYAE